MTQHSFPPVPDFDHSVLSSGGQVVVVEVTQTQNGFLMAGESAFTWSILFFIVPNPDGGIVTGTCY